MGTEEYLLGVDLFSLGCIFAELYTGRPLFGGCKDNVEVLQKYYSIFGSLQQNNVEHIYLKYPRYEEYKHINNKAGLPLSA